MVRKLALAATLVLLAFTFLGCDMIEEWLGTGKPDLTVNDVVTLTNSSGAITGARVLLGNSGTKDAVGVEFTVVLTPDETVSLTNDVLIYTGTADIAIGAEKQIDIGTADIDAYMKANSSTIPDAEYYIGVTVDPNDSIAEKSESNNEDVSVDTTWFIGGSPMLYVIQGTISIPLANLPLGYFTGSSYDDLQNGHAYPVYIFAVPSGIDLPTANGSVVTFSDWMIPGSAKVTMTYSGNAQSFKYTVGVPTEGEYYVAALMDADKNGSMTIQNGPGEPFAMWPPTSGMPTFTHIENDVTDANTDMSPGSNPL
jgi:hypothetical protein